MRIREKLIAAQLREFLFLNALFLLLASVSAAPCPAQNKTQSPAREKIVLTIVSVKPEITSDYENLIKNEFNPGIAKGGAKWSDVWRTDAFGNVFDYIFVSPVDSFAQYDAPDQLTRGLGAEGTAAFYAKASKMVTNVRSAAYEVRSDLSYNTKMTSSPKWAVISYVSVMPGRTAEYESFIKNDLLPVIKQSGIAGYWVHRKLFGGDPNEYLTVTLQDNFAELEKGPPQNRVLGQEGAMKLQQKLPVGVIVRQERMLARFVPELSYHPMATTNK